MTKDGAATRALVTYWTSAQVSRSALCHSRFSGRCRDARVLESLASHHTVIRYDARGLGLSDRNPPDRSQDSPILDIEAVAVSFRSNCLPCSPQLLGGQ